MLKWKGGVAEAYSSKIAIVYDCTDCTCPTLLDNFIMLLSSSLAYDCTVCEGVSFS